MEEIGLFTLGIVLLPGERVPLHIFEPRYRELIGECIDDEREFGLVHADDDGVREIGTRARVAELLERFDDGRMNVLVQGGERFRIIEVTGGRSFHTAQVEPVGDDDPGPVPDEADRALDAFRALAAVVEAEPEDPDPDSPVLSFDLAGLVELPAGAKQELLELRSEGARLARVASLFEDARRSVELEHAMRERASRNGTRPTG
jgi:Lon protease-like protein